MQFRLNILSGSRAGQSLVVPGPMLRFGRDPSCEVSFDPVRDDKVSGNHAQLLLTDRGELLLTDMGSSNGTFVNGQRIQRPTPISSGTIIVLGGDDGGVQVSISLSNPNDPNANKLTMLPGQAPLVEEPPKSKGKLVALLGCLALLVIGGIVGLVLLLTRKDGDEKTAETAETAQKSDAKTESAKTGAAKAEAAKTGAAKTEAKKTEAPKEKTYENPWQRYGVGTRFVLLTKSVTEVAGNKYESESKLSYELLELASDKAVVQMTMEAKGLPAPTVTKQEIPFQGPAGEQPEQKVEQKDETIEVPAGKFDCKWTKLETEAGGVKTVSESWTREDLPVPVKSKSTSATSTSSMELVEMEKK
ncbi:MAG: FHA domain-containing protein [Planctomycetota bacterium]